MVNVTTAVFTFLFFSVLPQLYAWRIESKTHEAPVPWVGFVTTTFTLRRFTPTPSCGVQGPSGPEFQTAIETRLSEVKCFYSQIFQLQF